MTVPNFLIVGAARSGTTGLVEGLRSHPQVFVTSPKEPHYFALHGRPADFRGPGDFGTINRVAVPELDAYLGLYPTKHRFAALGDGSVSTLYYADRAIPEILRINSQMRVVVLLREPVDRAYSNFMYMRGRGLEPCEDFLDAVAQEDRRREQNWQHIWHYTAMSHYAQSLRAFQQGLGKERVGVWFYDDLQANYGLTVRSVLRFLGLPTHESFKAPRVNVSGTPRVPLVRESIRWATRNERLRQSVKRMTTYRFRERIRRSTLRASRVSASARAELADRFTADLVELGALVEGQVPAWIAEHRAGSRSESG